MAQAYGFNHEAAIRSFERASELDPNAAMPHWGRAWALGPNYNLDIDDPRAKAAYEAISKARALASSGPERRALVHRSARGTLLSGHESRSRGARRVRTARRWASSRAAILTISMRPHFMPKA